MKRNIFIIISALICISVASELDFSSSSESSSSEEPESESLELSPDDVILNNLKELLRTGDEEYEIPVWAPFYKDDVEIDDVELPFTILFDGFDNFEKVSTKLGVNDTVEFELFFPKITSLLLWKPKEGGDLIFLEGTQLNTTLEGIIGYEPQRKCIRLLGINLAMDYDTVNYDIVKRGDVDPNAEDYIFKYFEFLRADNKEEMLDAYAELIEMQVQKIFDRLECWVYSEDKLLASIKNSL